jgi:NADH-quinone oxidoreductase subunit H
MTAFFQSLGLSYEWAWGLATLAGILLIALPLMLAVAMIIYAERKLWAAFALRRGPNVVGPFGVLQSFADGLKVFLQETIIPSAANRGLFLIAPIITFTVALMAWAVIPFNSGAVLADINVGLLYILAISSLGVYGVVIAGWASNSKYPFFSAMRAAAQMISYEVSIGFILICVVLWAGTFNMLGIVEAQKGHVLGVVNAFGLNPLLFPMAVMFLISAMAETARAPFDLTEAESELVAGYQTEYSSMAFALYWLGEYANVLLMCTLNAVLFWGGYLPPIDWAPLYYVPGWIWLFAKIWVFFFIFAWVKATVPRYRYDQLMRLGWKVFLPISLFWVCLVSGYLMWMGHWEPQKLAARNADTYECWANKLTNDEDVAALERPRADAERFAIRYGWSDDASFSSIVAPSGWKTDGARVGGESNGFGGNEQYEGSSSALGKVKWRVVQTDVHDGTLGIGIESSSTKQVFVGDCKMTGFQASGAKS